MRKVIAATKSHQADKLIDTVKEIGKRLVSAQPMGIFFFFLILILFFFFFF